MSDFTIGDNTIIHDSTIDPGKDGDVKVGDNTTISGSAIGNGANNDKKGKR